MTTQAIFPSRIGQVVNVASLGSAIITDEWGRYIIATVVAVTIALLLHHIFYSIAFKITRRRPGNFEDLLLKYSEHPTRVLLPLLAALWAVRQSPVPPDFVSTVSHVLGLAIIGCVGWLLIDLSNIVHELVVVRYGLALADNYSARRIHTQVTVLRHVLVIVIVLLTIAFMLMTFQEVRHFGETVAASAGLAGIIAGLAARPTLSSLIAGIQVAITQPIKLEDVVIVEGEWGRIEEISTTFVVVRIWDQRRMIVPLTYFIEKPFQNWTRHSSDIMGTVFLYLDYTVPVEDIRQELQRVVQSSDLWDGRVCGLQVTNTTDKSMELRCLVSSSDSGKNFDLRCLVRERLIAYIQKHHPESLPRVRSVLENAGTAVGVDENGALLRCAGNDGRAA
jgi:small-conductance mechanosensitive channel